MQIIETDMGPKCPMCAKAGYQCAIDTYGFVRLEQGARACASLLRIRAELVYKVEPDTSQYCCDQRAAIVPLPAEGRFLILGWYKERTQTEAAYILDEGSIRPATLVDLDEALRLCDHAEGLTYRRDGC